MRAIKGISSKSEDGFTLLELLVVILIVAILVLVGLPAFLGQQEKASSSNARQDLGVAYKSARYETVYNEGRYPSDADIKTAVEFSEPQLGDIEIVSETTDVDSANVHLITSSTTPTHLSLGFAVQGDSDQVMLFDHDTLSGETVFSGYSGS